MRTVLIVLMLIIVGCAIPPKRDSPDSAPPTPQERLYDSIKKSNWLVTLSILGIAAGVFALINGAAKLGAASIAASATSLYLSLAVARYAEWMAVCGLIGSIAAALFSIVARRRALFEIIEGNEIYKKIIEANPKAAYKQSFASVHDDVQSKSTRKLVADVRASIKKSKV